MAKTSGNIELYKKLKTQLEDDLLTEYHRRLLGLRQYCELEMNVEEPQLNFETEIISSNDGSPIYEEKLKEIVTIASSVSASDVVRKSIEFMGNRQFTINEIYKIALSMNKNIQKPTISAYLWKLSKGSDGSLKVVKQGAGNMPSTYQRK